MPESPQTQQRNQGAPGGAPRGGRPFGAAKKGAPRKRRKQQSEYGRQLDEKQKARKSYGLSEKQFANYVRVATETKGVDPKTFLYGVLESRLDSFIYRTGLSGFSRGLARQIVTHGHVTVNGRKLNIPAYQVQVGDVIAIREGSKSSALFENAKKTIEENKVTPPSWMSFDYKKLSGKLRSVPEAQKSELQVDFTSVFEFYSR